MLKTELEREILAKHPLYRKTDSDGVRQLAEQRCDSERAVRSIVQHFEQMREYAIRDLVQIVESRRRPTSLRSYVMLSAINDDRCCEFCLRIDGHTLNALDANLIEWFPPYCIDCRTSTITLTDKQAREQKTTPLEKAQCKLPTADFCSEWLFDHRWR